MNTRDIEQALETLKLPVPASVASARALWHQVADMVQSRVVPKPTRVSPAGT